MLTLTTYLCHDSATWDVATVHINSLTHPIEKEIGNE
jgi:hypothetical protein